MVKIIGKLHSAESAHEKMEIVKEFLENNSGNVFAYGTRKRNATNCGYLFIREKGGSKDVFSIMKIVDLIDKEEVIDDMRPLFSKYFGNFRNMDETYRFFLISKLVFVEIPFEDLVNRDGLRILPTSMNDLIWVEADIGDPFKN